MSEATLKLNQDGEKLTGTAKLEGKDLPVTGSVHDKAVTWQFDVDYNCSPLTMVFTVCSTTKSVGLFSLTTVSVPSPLELTAYPVLASKATPSDPAPIAGEARTLPESGSEIAITRLLQTENNRRFLTSIASPEGPSHGFNE